MSDKNFFVQKHPHYFRYEKDEKSKIVDALELNFLEGANVKHDIMPASQRADTRIDQHTGGLMLDIDPPIPIRSTYLKPGDELNRINTMK